MCAFDLYMSYKDKVVTVDWLQVDLHLASLITGGRQSY